MIINAYIFDGICDFHEQFLFSFYGGFIYVTVFCLFLNFDKNITDYADKNCCKYNKTGKFSRLYIFSVLL
ncbi:MAG: hypothetical protein BHV90_12375 [Clostridiales bacterium 42_27]|nr:MAG: hypothetical protein BHV90_12375 [Clostridiales bacterium 42_27]